MAALAFKLAVVLERDLNPPSAATAGQLFCVAVGLGAQNLFVSEVHKKRIFPIEDNVPKPLCVACICGCCWFICGVPEYVCTPTAYGRGFLQ